MMWPFRKKPTPKPPRIDMRDWNEDWKIGDTAECIVDGVTYQWHECVKPWERPEFRQQFVVTGFSEYGAPDNTIRYFLALKDWPIELPTTAFRKVRPVREEQSEVVSRILNAKPGKDRVRETVA